MTLSSHVYWHDIIVSHLGYGACSAAGLHGHERKKTTSTSGNGSTGAAVRHSDRRTIVAACRACIVEASRNRVGGAEGKVSSVLGDAQTLVFIGLRALTV
jgi:hypothetical protein